MQSGKDGIVFTRVQTGALNKRDRTIYALRHEGKTLEEIGQKFGLTRERVRQVCESIDLLNSGGVVLDTKFRRICTLLKVQNVQDFSRVSYSRILMHKHTSVRLVQELESALAEYNVQLVNDVDLDTFKKKAYKPVSVKKKTGPKLKFRKRIGASK